MLPNSVDEPNVTVYQHSWVYTQNNQSQHTTEILAYFYHGTIPNSKIWNQPRCTSTDEWIKKMWCIYRYTHNGVLFSHNEQNCVICRKMDRTGDHHKWNKPDLEK
jgi:hypothetical protein